MPRPQHVSVDLTELTVYDPSGRQVRLGELTGVRVVVLLRHRH